MQQEDRPNADVLNYTSVGRPSDKLRLLANLIACASFALPFLGFAGLILGQGSRSVVVVYLVSLYASFGLAAVALCGIPWWGERNVWGPAVLGAAISVFLLIMSKYGGD